MQLKIVKLGMQNQFGSDPLQFGQKRKEKRKIKNLRVMTPHVWFNLCITTSQIDCVYPV